MARKPSLDAEVDYDELDRTIDGLLADRVEPAKIPVKEPPEPVPQPHPGREMTREQTPAVAYVKSINPDYLVISEVAEMLGVSKTTLRNWMKDPNHPTSAPSLQAQFGKMKIYIYTREDVDELVSWLDARSGVKERESE